VPDVDVRAPAELGSQGMQFSVNDFRVRRFDPSMGYARGSHFQTSEEKRPIQTPGVTLKVPLQ
jgi:hypothetical protein